MINNMNANSKCMTRNFIIAAIVAVIITVILAKWLSLFLSIVLILVLLVIGWLISAKLCQDSADKQSKAAPVSAPQTPVATKIEPAPVTKEKAPETNADQGKPELLSKARDGGADDLKKIKGVGPKLEKELNAAGVFHYDQIAGWSKAEIEWADQNLVSFKGRVSRDSWVDQAKELAKNP